MKRIIGVLEIALLLSCGAGRVFAQTDAATPKASDAPKASETKIEEAPTTYRLTYTITELDGSKRIGTQRISLTTNPDRTQRDSQVKLGSKVPIATASSNPEKTEKTEFQYIDIGLSISAHLREFTDSLEVYSRVEQTSVSEEQSTVGIKDPVIRQARLENTALLTPGKPVMLGSLDVPGSTRHLDIEVMLEVVR
jgi:hypothetical protein